MIELHLPLIPPSTNAIWTRTKNGMRLSDKYRGWLEDVTPIANAQRQGRHVVGPYRLSIQAVRPDKRRRDLDNLLKSTSDLLVKIGAVSDDSLCEIVTARWVTAGEGVTVFIEKVGTEL